MVKQNQVINDIFVNYARKRELKIIIIRDTNKNIVQLTKEGLRIRSTARVLKITSCWRKHLAHEKLKYKVHLKRNRE